MALKTTKETFKVYTGIAFYKEFRKFQVFSLLKENNSEAGAE